MIFAVLDSGETVYLDNELDGEGRIILQSTDPRTPLPAYRTQLREGPCFTTLAHISVWNLTFPEGDQT